MLKELLVSSSDRETRVAVLEDGRVAEVQIERRRQRGVVGNIYKGRVTRVLPGMQSAFVDLGLEKDAFLYVADVGEEVEDFDRFGATDEAPEAVPDRNAATVGTASAAGGATGPPGTATTLGDGAPAVDTPRPLPPSTNSSGRGRSSSCR